MTSAHKADQPSAGGLSEAFSGISSLVLIDHAGDILQAFPFRQIDQA